MTGRHIIVAALATLAAISARADWNIGVMGNRVKVEGDAIRPWNPRSLGAKLACWFDADDPATLLDAGGAPADAAEAVQTWQDKSGNARHATAPEGANRPTRQVNVQNGRAVVRTDGNDSLSVNGAPSVFRNKTAGYIFVVAKDPNQTGVEPYYRACVMWLNNTTGGRFLIDSQHTGFAATGWVVAGRRLDADTAIGIGVGTSAGHSIVRARADWAGGKLYASLDGAAEASASYSSGAGSSADTDSSKAYLFGIDSSNMSANSEIAEVIVVNAAMSTDEIKAINNYLRKKWGTP